MFRASLDWVKVVAPKRLDVALTVGAPNSGVLVTLNASARNSIRKRSWIRNALNNVPFQCGQDMARRPKNCGFGAKSTVGAANSGVLVTLNASARNSIRKRSWIRNV